MKDRDGASGNTDHTSIAQVLQDAGHAFPGSANILRNFFVRHVESYASTITGGLPMLFGLVDQELRELRMGVRS